MPPVQEWQNDVGETQAPGEQRWLVSSLARMPSGMAAGLWHIPDSVLLESATGAKFPRRQFTGRGDAERLGGMSIAGPANVESAATAYFDR